jgi:transcriptional regulator with XRE-family HTH domain
MTIGEEIRKKRRQMHLSQREASGLLGLEDHSMLAKIESGIRFPRGSVLNFAEWLGIPANEILRRLGEEKIERNLLNPKVMAKPTFLPIETMESMALEDRNKYLRIAGTDRINLPRDREKIPEILFGLRVVFADYLFGSEGDMLYGGLFPKGCYYHYTDKVIVISTHGVRKEGLVSEETKTFQLFHEMGHYRLHLDEDVSLGPFRLPPDRPVYCSAGGAYKPLEFQANAYALAFLIPEAQIRGLIGRRRIIDRQEFEEKLRFEFGVSKQVILRRLKRLGIQVI